MALFDVAIIYFEELFTTRVHGDPSHILEGVVACIIDEMNSVFNDRFTKREVLCGCEINGTYKSLGLDGLPTLFY